MSNRNNRGFHRRPRGPRGPRGYLPSRSDFPGNNGNSNPRFPWNFQSYATHQGFQPWSYNQRYSQYQGIFRYPQYPGIPRYIHYPCFPPPIQYPVSPGYSACQSLRLQNSTNSPNHRGNRGSNVHENENSRNCSVDEVNYSHSVTPTNSSKKSNRNLVQTKSSLDWIKADDIQEFLEAWCQKRKIIYKYECEKIVTVFEIHHVKLTVDKPEYIVSCESFSTNTGKNICAWKFFNYLDKCGHFNKGHLPKKLKIRSELLDTDEELLENGGWTFVKSDQRMKQILKEEECQLSYKSSTVGKNLKHYQCEMSFKFHMYETEYSCIKMANDHLTAERYCYHFLIRAFFKAGLIERQGEPQVIKKRCGHAITCTNENISETGDDASDTGGWTIKNSEEGLKQFCQGKAVQISYFKCDQAIQASNLEVRQLTVEKKQRTKYFFHETGTTATQLCRRNLIRKLFKEGLICEFKNEAIQDNSGKPYVENVVPKRELGTTLVKRNNENVSTYLKDGKKLKGVDENGNWTFSNSTDRLRIFCVKNSLTFEITAGLTTDTTKNLYSVTLKLVKVDGRKDSLSVESEVTGENLHKTKVNAILKVVGQLYQSGIIEGGGKFHTEIV